MIKLRWGIVSVRPLSSWKVVSSWNCFAWIWRRSIECCLCFVHVLASVGRGSSRIRSLFEDARRAAPSVVFIDELDALGTREDDGSGAGRECARGCQQKVEGEAQTARKSIIFSFLYYCQASLMVGLRPKNKNGWWKSVVPQRVSPKPSRMAPFKSIVWSGHFWRFRSPKIGNYSREYRFGVMLYRDFSYWSEWIFLAVLGSENMWLLSWIPFWGDYFSWFFDINILNRSQKWRIFTRLSFLDVWMISNTLILQNKRPSWLRFLHRIFPWAGLWWLVGWLPPIWDYKISIFAKRKQRPWAYCAYMDIFNWWNSKGDTGLVITVITWKHFNFEGKKTKTKTGIVTVFLHVCIETPGAIRDGFGHSELRKSDRRTEIRSPRVDMDMFVGFGARKLAIIVVYTV